MNKLARMTLTALGFVVVLGAFAGWVTPKLIAQVRAALVQNRDEPGRNPFVLTGVQPEGGWVVPTGQLYVIESFAMNGCNVSFPGTMTDITLWVNYGINPSTASIAPHLVSQGDANNYSVYSGSSTTRLYAGAASTIRVLPSLVPFGGAIGCITSVSGYSITLP